MNAGHIFVVGAPSSGKSTFSSTLSRLTGFTHSDTGHELAKILARIYMAGDDSVSKVRFEMRVENISRKKPFYRPQLIELGNALCDANPMALIKLCMWARIISGVRRFNEAASYINSKGAGSPDDLWVLIKRRDHAEIDNFEADAFERSGLITDTLDCGSMNDVVESAEKFAARIK
jgi:hypothetical protein